MSEPTNLPAKLPELRTGAPVKAVVPTSMDEAYRLAKAVCMSGLAPRGLDKPEAAMVAILHGMEIGLTPMMALQKIAVINGRPTLWGDGALGLVRASGLCKYVKEWIDGADDRRIAYCETLRAGETDPVKRAFSVADAKKAGLWGKQGPWQNFPERMLQMRARAFTLRDTYADVLGGMYLAEELQGEEPTHYNAAPGSRLTPPPAPAIEAPKQEAETTAAAPKAPEPVADAPKPRGRGKKKPEAVPAPEPAPEPEPQPEATAGDLVGDWAEYLDRQYGEWEGLPPALSEGVSAAVEDAVQAALESGEISREQSEAILEKWREKIG